MIVQSEISQEKGKTMSFYKRSYQLILRYLYTEAIKRWDGISLHRHLKYEQECFMRYSWHTGKVSESIMKRRVSSVNIGVK